MTSITGDGPSPDLDLLTLVPTSAPCHVPFDVVVPRPEKSLAVGMLSARSDPTFAAFYQTRYHRTVSQLVGVTGNLDEAEDAAQEAFVRAAQRWDEVRTYEFPDAWVRKVAVNLAISSLRRRIRGAAVVHRWRHRLGPGVEPGPDSAGVDRMAMIQAMRRLPLNYRAVLALHHLADLDVAAVADMLDLPVGTVKTRLTRGRARLRRLLEADDAWLLS